MGALLALVPVVIGGAYFGWIRLQFRHSEVEQFVRELRTAR